MLRNNNHCLLSWAVYFKLFLLLLKKVLDQLKQLSWSQCIHRLLWTLSHVTIPTSAWAIPSSPCLGEMRSGLIGRTIKLKYAVSVVWINLPNLRIYGPVKTFLIVPPNLPDLWQEVLAILYLLIVTYVLQLFLEPPYLYYVICHDESCQFLLTAMSLPLGDSTQWVKIIIFIHSRMAVL